MVRGMYKFRLEFIIELEIDFLLNINTFRLYPNETRKASKIHSPLAYQIIIG